MKTIEEAANDYSVRKDNESESYDGFKAGIEFAQRWIPVEEELPGKVSSVMVRDDGCSQIRSVAVFLNGKFYPDVLLNHDQVTHWRPIDLK